MDRNVDAGVSQLTIRKQRHNVNRHTAVGSAALDNSIDRDGLIGALTIAGDGEVFDGSDRTRKLGDALNQLPLIVQAQPGQPVIVQNDGTSPIVNQRMDIPTAADPKAVRLGIAGNQIGAMNWNPDIDLLKTIAESDLDVAALINSDALAAMNEGSAELGKLLATLDPPQVETADAGELEDKADALQKKYDTALGQIWQLGEHRLIIGDCTDKTTIDALMQGEKAQAVVTDPPFNVRDDKWDTFKGDDAFIAFTATWLRLGKGIADSIVCFMADKNVPMLLVASARAEIPYRRALIWRKPPGSQFAGASLDGFWYDFEIIQVFGKPIFKPRQDTQMAVLEHRTVTGQEHGCEKPVALLMELIEGYSERGAIVVDLFGGVGTALIGCQQTNRICRMAELEPNHAAVTLERWSLLTGATPHRLALS